LRLILWRRIALAVTGLSGAAWLSLAAMSAPGDAPIAPAVPPVPTLQAPWAPHEFFFTRAIYSSYGRRGFRGSWATDYPEADQKFVSVLGRLTAIDAYQSENPVRLDDPLLRRYPFLYAVEVGNMGLTEGEALGLRDYLLAGGFLVVDDFWGTYEWQNFEVEIRRVLPDHPIVDIPLDHPLFSSYYDIDEILQIPNIGQGRRGGPTYERDGFVATVRGIFDEQDRLMVVINFNTDLGDAWEWMDDPYYPLKYSTYAYQMGVNMIVYGMSH